MSDVVSGLQRSDGDGVGEDGVVGLAGVGARDGAVERVPLVPCVVLPVSSVAWMAWMAVRVVPGVARRRAAAMGVTASGVMLCLGRPAARRVHLGQVHSIKCVLFVLKLRMKPHHLHLKEQHTIQSEMTPEGRQERQTLSSTVPCAHLVDDALSHCATPSQSPVRRLLYRCFQTKMVHAGRATILYLSFG
jgi:hypothetical protein